MRICIDLGFRAMKDAIAASASFGASNCWNCASMIVADSESGCSLTAMRASSTAADFSPAACAACATTMCASGSDGYEPASRRMVP